MPSAAVTERPQLRVVGPDDPAPRRARRSSGARPSPDRRPDRSVALLLGSTALLTVIGLVMVLSASSVSAFARYGSSFLFFKRQLAYALVGMVALAFAARLRYRVWQRWCVPLLLVSLVLLIVVLHPAAGTVAGGSARWLRMGPISMQPSELAKLAVVAFGAALMARRWRWIRDLRQLALPLVPVVAVVCGLILLQPDMGTAVIVAAAVFVVMFVAGARLRHLAFAFLGAGGLGFVAIYSEGYRWTRFISFMNPWADPQGSGYQTIQSLIALASGGPFGVGLGAGRQKWAYVPNAHTDFIFSIIGEELGLAGNFLVLALFGAFLYAGIRIAVRAPDAFGRLLAAGITGWIGTQALVNLGAVTGMLPITGVPLPFVSFGGSSLVVSLTAVGVLASVGRARRRSRAAVAEAALERSLGRLRTPRSRAEGKRPAAGATPSADAKRRRRSAGGEGKRRRRRAAAPPEPRRRPFRPGG